MEEKLLLDFTQIIPMKDSEDYMIKMAEKNQEVIINRERNRGRAEINKNFWNKFLDLSKNFSEW